MKIESLQLYDGFDNYFHYALPAVAYDYEFRTLYEVAVNVRQLLQKTKSRQAIVFVDNGRYMLVHEHCFQVHYIGYFQDSKK